MGLEVFRSAPTPGDGRVSLVWLLAGSLVVLALVNGVAITIRPSPVAPAQELAGSALPADSMALLEVECVPRIHPVFSSAGDTQFDDSEEVMVVEIGGVSRAFPLSILEKSASAHVINDELNGLAYSVTWCGLTKTGAVFDRTVDGTIVPMAAKRFSGCLWLYSPETLGTWRQTDGSSDDKERPALAQLPFETSTLAQWRESSGQTGELYIGDEVDRSEKLLPNFPNSYLTGYPGIESWRERDRPQIED
jgi:hypothetical protein